MKTDKPLALVFQFAQAGMGKPVPDGPRKPSSRSAAINRWTGKPHEHNRAKARGLKHIATLAPLGVLLNAARKRRAA